MNILYCLVVMIFCFPLTLKAEERTALEAAYGAQVRSGDDRHWDREKVEYEHRDLPLHESRTAVHRDIAVTHDQTPTALQTARGAQGNRALKHRHNKTMYPRYNYYRNQYHLYPYVYVSPTVYVSSSSVPVTVDGNNYYYDQGTFYQTQDQQYTPTAPPIGAIVPTLPPGVAQVVVNDQVYYVLNGVYYKPVTGGYEVVAPVSL